MRRRGRPLLSVVVPLHNTAAYVEECLDSIVAQEVTDLEVVLVDDDSTDGCLDVAVRAAKDRLPGIAVRTDRRGTGGARNLGARLASGTYLTFLDSDDAVLPDGYAQLLATLEQSGSDFASGSAVRGLSLDEAVVPRWIGAVHRQRRIGVDATSFPEMTRDILTPNKIFRRSFWRAADVRFPERVRYEDQVAITQAYLRARTVDVIPEPAYFWRVRADGSSITQRRDQLPNLQDRVVTKLLTSRVVEESGNAAVAEVWRTYGLLGDLPEYLRHLPGCADDFWALLRDGLRLVADHDVIAGSNLHVTQRIAAALVLDGDREAATAMVTHIQGGSGGLPLEVHPGGGVLARAPHTVRVETQPPHPVRLLHLRDVGWGFDVDDLDVDGQVVTVAGSARTGSYSDVPPVELACSLVGTATGVEVELPVRDLGERRIAVEIDPTTLPPGEHTWGLRFRGRLGHLSLPRVPGAWHRVAGPVTGSRVAGTTVEVDAEGRRGLALRVDGRDGQTSGASRGAQPSTPRQHPAPAGAQPRGFELPRR